MIKIGGSLSETPAALEVLGAELSLMAKKFSIVVVPGGGKFSDAVRELDAKFNLSASVAHKMAILAMDQYGLLLSNLFKECEVCDSLRVARQIARGGKLPVFLPSRLMFEKDPFEPSWDVTSDSIAAYIAILLHAKRTILATDVDGIFNEDPKRQSDAKLFAEISSSGLMTMGKRTSVDKFLPKLLSENALPCYVVNGRHPERIVKVLLGRQSTGTQIV